MWAILVGVVLVASSFDHVEPVGHLGSFLESYVGTCDRRPPKDRRACRAEVAAARERAEGRLVRVEGDPNAQLTVRRFDDDRGTVDVVVLPFWSASGLAMSAGRPQRLDRSGRPLVRTLPMSVELPDDVPAFMARRKIEQGRVRVSWVVRPTSVWTLRGRDGDRVRGVAVRPLVLQIADPRSGDVWAEKTWTPDE